MGLSVTDFELKVLSVLWAQGGQATVQSVLENWDSNDPPGYTTILKTLQKLEAKGSVTHEQGPGRAYTYVATVTRREATRNRFSQLIGTVFRGDPLAFTHAFLEQTDLTDAEIDELRGLLDEYKRSAAPRAMQKHQGGDRDD
jgi:predicted transcriptional regulator